ncbi:MAG: CoA transferase, partial [Chloroflexi bacterium]|nr:CoA transferase [Chloroflexota bacterium]
MAKALDDLRVIEVANGWGGPLTGRLLADLGAEVIKIELPEGDPLRRQPPFKNGVSYAFEMTSAGKKSVVLDLTTPSGSNSLHQLIEGADVLLCDSSVWELSEIWLRYDELRKTNPGLIYCSLTPFGLTGPLSRKLASDTVVQAMSGVMATTGWPGGPATKAGPALAEHIGAVFATIGIAAALNHRDRTGRGQSVDIAMHDCLVTYLAIYLPQYFVTGEAPPREGNRHTMSAPWNSYPTKDGFVIICSANDKLWNQLIQAIGREDLIGDPRYDTPPKRRQRVDEVDDIVSEWTRTKTIDEAIAVMDRVGIPAGSISRIDRLLSDPHFHHRQLLVEVEDPLAGKMPTIGSPFKMSEITGVVIGPAPYLGQHTDEVLHQLTPTREKRVQPVAGAQNGARALEGIRIIDFGNLTAGPFSTRILSNLGAEVIKVEALDGDHARHLPPQIKGMGYLFIINNTDKKSVTLDLRAPEAKQIVRELVARGDALLENFGPGAMERQGLGYEDLKAVKPDIIYCSVNGFGGSGPNRSKRAYDTVIQAMAGIMSITG